jgi:hypothetical protein
MYFGVQGNSKLAWPLLLHATDILVVVNYWIGSRFGRDRCAGFLRCVPTLAELFRVFGERLEAIESMVSLCHYHLAHPRNSQRSPKSSLLPS